MTNRFLHQIPRIYDGLDRLLRDDPVFSRLSLKPADLPARYMDPGFCGLVRIVIGQQVSTSAANALWERFRQMLPVPTPNGVLALDDDDMRALGLSSQKARYIRGLAQAVKDGGFDPDALVSYEDGDIAARITALNGFGDWSAQMYLMFSLARPDIWSPGDLGIREGLRRYYGLDERPDMPQAEKMGDIFAPDRTAASLLLWHLAAGK